ncbi:MAG: hypothetical protein ACT4PT_08660 [Methanobacteriota archaeon]
MAGFTAAAPQDVVVGTANDFVVAQTRTNENTTGNVSGNVTNFTSDPDQVGNASNYVQNVTIFEPVSFAGRTAGNGVKGFQNVSNEVGRISSQQGQGVDNVTKNASLFITLAGQAAQAVCNNDTGYMTANTGAPCRDGSIGKTILTSGALTAVIALQNNTRKNAKSACFLANTTFNVPTGGGCAVIET